MLGFVRVTRDVTIEDALDMTTVDCNVLDIDRLGVCDVLESIELDARINPKVAAIIMAYFIF